MVEVVGGLRCPGASRLHRNLLYLASIGVSSILGEFLTSGQNALTLLASRPENEVAARPEFCAERGQNALPESRRDGYYSHRIELLALK